MRLLLATVLTALLVFILLATAPLKPSDATTDPAQLIEDASDLVLLATRRRCNVQTEVSGWLGHTTVTGSVRATVWIGTDLSQATVRSIDHERRQVHLELIEPTVKQVSLDHVASTITCERGGLWGLALGPAHEADLTHRLFEQAQRELTESTLDPMPRQRARLQAEVVLQQLFEAQRWHVHVTWSP